MARTFFCTLSLIVTLAAASAATETNQLDPRYVDADGDLIADAPTDPKLWDNPATLIFAYTPVEDPAVYRDVWKEFMDHLSKKTGKKTQFFAVQSNAAQLEAMRAGRLHVTAFNTGSVPIAVNMAGFVPFCMMANTNGEYGYQMEIIVPVDSPIQEVKDLKGRQLAFTQPTSNSGFKSPSLILEREFGLKADRDFKSVFSGKHDNSILGVMHGDYEAASIANTVLRRMIQRGTVDSSKIRSIYKSKTFPTSGYGYAHNLDPELAKKIREAFFTFEWEGTGLEKEFSSNGERQFIPAEYRKVWQIVRDIDAALGIAYREK